MVNQIKTVGIAGAGVMGSGIAFVCANAGYKVLLLDKNKVVLEKAKDYLSSTAKKAIERGLITAIEAENIISRILLINEVKELQAEIVIEAIIENLEIKQQLFIDIASNNDSKCILATNTSSIPITQIASVVSHPERVVGIHFFNPAHIMKLVEIISGVQTSENVAKLAFDFAISIGKKAIVAKDSPGFIVNRVARHYYVEALKLFEEGIAKFEDIDELAESSGFKMGPFRLMDLIGVETNYSVTETMFKQFNFDSKFRPSRIQKQKVDAGLFGQKTGKGFYDYKKG